MRLNINTNYTKELMQAFIDDSLYHSEDKLNLGPNDVVVKYEIIDSSPLQGHISGVLFIHDIIKDTITEFHVEFKQSKRMKEKIKDNITLNIISDNTFGTEGSYSVKQLSNLLSSDIITLYFIERYVVSVINAKRFFPYNSH